MKTFKYNTKGVCSERIELKIDNGILEFVKIEGGCTGNIQGLCKLTLGMEAEEVVRRLKGIDCDNKGTSCPDQLAAAIENYINEINRE